MRQCGISLMDLTGRGLKGQMKYADREKIRYVLILGDDELAENVVIVKDMILGEQEKIPMDSIIKYMRNEIDKTSCSD